MKTLVRHNMLTDALEARKRTLDTGGSPAWESRRLDRGPAGQTRRAQAELLLRHRRPAAALQLAPPDIAQEYLQAPSLQTSSDAL
jgi:hypothetical protein